MRALTLSAFLAFCGVAQAAAPADERLYHREQQVQLPGAGSSWGFIALDPSRPYLFLARRENGLSVFDVDKQRPVRTIEQSTGANGVVLVPELNRLLVLNTDGSLGLVELSTLKPLKRIAVTQSNLNSAVYEPRTGQVIIVSGRRADRSTLFVFDPKEERITAAHELAVKKIDPLLLKGDGSFFLPMRDEGIVARLSSSSFKVLDRWQYPDCQRPSALAQDEQRGRLFVACRGERPVLLVLDRDSGALKARLPITRDVNALAYDPQAQRLLIASGVDANLSVVAQLDADRYQALGSVSTQPMAYNMAFDPRTRRVYLAAMDFTQPAASPAEPKPDPLFHANTFKVITLAP